MSDCLAIRSLTAISNKLTVTVIVRLLVTCHWSKWSIVRQVTHWSEVAVTGTIRTAAESD